MNRIRGTYNTKAVLGEIKVGSQKNVEKAALRLQRAIQTTLTGQRSGQEYVVSKSGKTHIASAPGEAPAVLSGDLRASIDVGDGESPLVKYVGSDKLYALFLEEGTRYMEPRPFFVDTMLEVFRQLRGDLSKRID